MRTENKLLLAAVVVGMLLVDLLWAGEVVPPDRHTAPVVTHRVPAAPVPGE